MELMHAHARRSQGLRVGLIAFTAAVILAACASSQPGTTTTPPPATLHGPIATGPTLLPLRFDGVVTAGGGRSLTVQCQGTGSPTILLEGGGTSSSLGDFGPTFPLTLAAHTTVCRYSHPGGDGSSPVTTELTWADVLGDADAVLAAVKDRAGIDGPYVFVGWSFGGEIALGEAVEKPSRTAGLVILDTDFPVDLMGPCRAAGRTQADCQAEFDSDREAKVIEVGLVKTIKPLPGIPILLVSAMRPGPDCAIAPGASAVTYGMSGQVISAPDCNTLLQRVADKGLTQWSSVGKVSQTRVDADHDGIIREAGSQIADLILGLVASVR